jgi:hypothetical protein
MTVSRLKKSYISTLPSPARERPCILSVNTLRQINRNVLKGVQKTGKDVHKHFQQEGVQITYRATMDNLQKIGIQGRKKNQKAFPQ